MSFVFVTYLCLQWTLAEDYLCACDHHHIACFPSTKARPGPEQAHRTNTTIIVQEERKHLQKSKQTNLPINFMVLKFNKCLFKCYILKRNVDFEFWLCFQMSAQIFPKMQQFSSGLIHARSNKHEKCLF